MRLFKENSKIKTITLDGMWDFKLDPQKEGFECKWFEKFPDNCEKIVVPSCWNNELGKYDYEGMAWYSTKFFHDGVSIKIHFGAVATFAKVYLDGNYLGEHYGGFTAFNFIVHGLDSGEHTLTVMADNTHDDYNTIPLSGVDWFHYGGIIRPVEITALPDFWVDAINIKYTLSENLKNVAVILEVITDGRLSENSEYKLYIDDNFLRDVPLIKGINVIEMSLKDIELWDTENPRLYYFKLVNKNDEKIERTGFRKILIEGYNITLNNKPIKINGINRHEEHPDWGFSIPLKLIKKDMDILFDMGCNSVRGSHYPNSKEFADYCDEVGMLFWSEIPLWQFHENELKNPLIIKRSLHMMKEMIEQYYNHPSIIIWGLHNECDTETQGGLEITQLLHSKIKSMDNSRLITFATDRPLADICLKYCDFVSVNMYIGWYHGTLEDWEDFLCKLDEKLNKEDLSHLPVVISEFGAAGIYGDCNFESPKWSENYQSKYLKTTIKLFNNRRNIAGTYVWQFADARVCKEKAMGRARSFNNKGILNEYRKPKMAYYTVRELYRGCCND